MKTIYRVILRVGYCESHFEFEGVNEASEFAKTALYHMVDSEDTKKKTSIVMQIVDVEAEKKEKESKESEEE